MTHIMIDLETLSTRPDAAIMSIGAAAFCPKRQTIFDTFHMKVDPESSVALGLHVDVSTIKWWMRQSDEARAQWNGPSHPLATALSEFSVWVNEAQRGQHGSLEGLWGNGATFDNVVLASAYKAAGQRQPWSYRADRCFRTLKALHPGVKAPPFEGVAHDALADARHQAQHALAILNQAALTALCALHPGVGAIIEGGAVAVPRELTAANGAKAALIGDFKFRIEMEWEGEDLSFAATVPWPTIKEIWKAAVGHFAPPPSPAAAEGV